MRFKENFNMYAPLGDANDLESHRQSTRLVQMSPHVSGDTTILIWIAESIIEHEKAMWLLNPLSVTGWIEYSYPISVPIQTTITSMMTGLTRVDLVIALSFSYIIKEIYKCF